MSEPEQQKTNDTSATPKETGSPKRFTVGSVLGWMSGKDNIRRLFHTQFTARGGRAALDGGKSAFKLLTENPDKKGVPGLDFDQAVAVYELSESDLEDRRRGSRDHAWLYCIFAIACPLFVGVFGAPITWIVTAILSAMFSALAFRAAFRNWQIRCRRMGGVQEFLHSGHAMVPR
jgi:hypothetical protein